VVCDIKGNIDISCIFLFRRYGDINSNIKRKWLKQEKIEVAEKREEELRVREKG
jgi:hypothetical protein